MQAVDLSWIDRKELSIEALGLGKLAGLMVPQRGREYVRRAGSADWRDGSALIRSDRLTLCFVVHRA